MITPFSINQYLHSINRYMIIAIISLILGGSIFFKDMMFVHAEEWIKELYDEERWGIASINGQYHGGGACTLDPPPTGVEGHYPVAISGGMFGNSDLCGMCLQFKSPALDKENNGDGNDDDDDDNDDNDNKEGQEIVYVGDICPNCSWSEMGVYAGDDFGVLRFDVEWKAVPCPTGNGSLEYMFLDSDAFFIKVQVRNSPNPIKSLKIWDRGSDSFVNAWRSKDNFFQTTLEKPAQYPLPVKLEDVLGEKIEDQIPFQGTNYHVVPGKNQFSAAKGFNDQRFMGRICFIVFFVIITHFVGV